MCCMHVSNSRHICVILVSVAFPTVNRYRVVQKDYGQSNRSNWHLVGHSKHCCTITTSTTSQLKLNVAYHAEHIKTQRVKGI
jgi:hypothetical protein